MAERPLTMESVPPPRYAVDPSPTLTPPHERSEAHANTVLADLIGPSEVEVLREQLGTGCKQAEDAEHANSNAHVS